MAGTGRQRIPMRRWIRAALAPLLAAALFFGTAGTARGAGADEELPNGRLGYRWTPDPPKQPMSGPDQFALDVAKYVGGGILAIWLLRKLFGSD